MTAEILWRWLPTATWILLTALVGFGGQRLAQAGGGPENVVLVVNPQSWSSRTIANHYIDLRYILPENVIEVPWDENQYSIDIQVLRDKLLGFVLREIERRDLRFVDYIVYSSGFPYQIMFTEEAAAGDQFPGGSLTGLTYLWPLVMTGAATDGPVFAELNTNWYFSRSGQDDQQGPTRGFQGRYAWRPDGSKLDDLPPGQSAQRYFLSVMLGYTGTRGNSTAEVLNYLRRSATVDGTFPKGTIYYCRTDDVRSVAREGKGAFLRAMTELRALGQKAQLIEGVLPPGADDVQGVMTGVSDFQWERSNSSIRPGAIAEHFTSFGARFYHPEQTPISEWLRYGAAGSSGAVIEPYAILSLPFQPKFPHPRIHVHYVKGCSLAESFYQSVAAPYQLLILGDPLCRPWARIPTIAIGGISLEKPLSGNVVFAPASDGATGQTIREYRIYLDGKLVGVKPSGGPIGVSTEDFADGYHELRLVAVEDSPLETQGRFMVGLEFDNRGRRAELQMDATQSVPWTGSLPLQAKAEGADQIEIYHGRTMLHRSAGASASFQLEPRHVGSGPVSLYAVGVYNDSPLRRVSSRPVKIDFGWPAGAK